MHKTANNVRAGQSAITQTSRVGEGQHVFEHLILQFAVFSKPRRNQNLPRVQKLRPQAAGDDASRICLHFHSQCDTLIYMFLWRMHAAFGLFYWIMELLAFASRQFAPKYGPQSASFTLFLFLFSCERA